MNSSILYVWLPVSKIYPLGITYLANSIHHQRPSIRQHILDLSLIPRQKRKKILRETILSQTPGIVVFSWRDIQIFAPHEGHDSIKYAFNFFYSWNPVKKIISVFYGLKSLYSITTIFTNRYRTPGRSFANFRIRSGWWAEARLTSSPNRSFINSLKGPLELSVREKAPS